MPRGNNLTIASNTGALARTTTGDTRNSLLFLNPNNGIIYVAINTQANPLVWDFVVPSQSRALLPGPWLSYGLYYVDQSGANAPGSVTVFESDVQIQVPDYAAIGIARLAQVTSVDLTEGVRPGNPGSGILRMWPDGTDFLHLLNSAGVDATVIDTLTALGGVLSGTLPNPGLATGAALANLVAHSITQLQGGVFGSPTSTTSATLVNNGDSINFSLATLADVFFIYQGSFQNSVIATTNFQLGVDGSFVDYPHTITCPGANYGFEISIIAASTGVAAGNHLVSAFFATAGGTLAQANNRWLLVAPFYR